MARIRSIHPGLFTDEAYMMLGFAERQLLIGIWCEAWDDGVFEWKPLTLKARIFPVDDLDVAEALAVIETTGAIKRFEVNGKRYGLVRNFRKYQRPKKPNESGFLPPEFRTFVGLTEANPEPVRNQFGTSSEKSPQMEDGGGRREEKGTTDVVPKKPKRGTAIKPDWVLTPADIEHAFLKGFSETQIAEQANAFRDYHLAKGTCFKDWGAGWRTWIRNARRFGGGPGSGPQGSGRSNQGTSLAAVAARREFDRQAAVDVSGGRADLRDADGSGMRGGDRPDTSSIVRLPVPRAGGGD